MKRYPITLLILCFSVFLWSQAVFACYLSSSSYLRPAAAIERIKKPNPLGSLSDEELIGFTQDAMTLSGDPNELLIFNLVLKELGRRGWSRVFIVFDEEKLESTILKGEHFIDFSKTRDPGLHRSIEDPEHSWKTLMDLVATILNLSYLPTDLYEFLNHSSVNFFQHARKDMCMYLLKQYYDEKGRIQAVRAVALNKGTPFTDTRDPNSHKELSIVQALEPGGSYGGGLGGYGLNLAICRAKFVRIETHHEKMGCRRVPSGIRAPEAQIIYQYKDPAVSYVNGVILDAVFYDVVTPSQPWRDIAERDKARIETLIKKSRVGSFASEVAKFKKSIILSSI